MENKRLMLILPVQSRWLNSLRQLKPPVPASSQSWSIPCILSWRCRMQPTPLLPTDLKASIVYDTQHVMLAAPEHTSPLHQWGQAMAVTCCRRHFFGRRREWGKWRWRRRMYSTSGGVGAGRPMVWAVSLVMAAVMSVPLPCTVSRCLRSSYQASSSYSLGGLRNKSTPATIVGNGSHGNTSGNVPSNTDKDELDLTFSDHEKAFRSKTNWEMSRALLIFKCCSFKPLVDNNMMVSWSILDIVIFNYFQIYYIQVCVN